VQGKVAFFFTLERVSTIELSEPPTDETLTRVPRHLSFIFSINEFIIASRLLQSTDKFTLPVGLYGFINDKYAQQWGPFCAGVVLAAVPVVILFFFLQRFITEGLTRGAVKG
jgi:ABC-type maltose transport system permease subunit